MSRNLDNDENIFLAFPVQFQLYWKNYLIFVTFIGLCKFQVMPILTERKE
jgi:hypothetical protein